MGGTQRAFSQSGSDDESESDNELTELSSRIDSVGRLVDVLASSYHWTIEYVLDQPYTKLRELLNAMKLREYVESLKLFRLHNLAQGGDKQQVEQFFAQLKPKIKQVTTPVDTPHVVPTRFEVMDLSVGNFIKKD